jgi:two-component system cell cycle sensor histidine kinase/response regulator CckA
MVALLDAVDSSIFGRQRTGRILVADDEPGVLQVVARVLRQGGFLPMLATDGTDALAQLDGADEPVDLVLTDIMMPGLDGLAVARTVRERYPELPVLLMSGSADAVAVMRHLEDPRIRFIPKPFDAAGLLGAIRSHLT